MLLDVHDWLAARITAAEDAGIPRERIIVDPGIGFGKTLAHNLALHSRPVAVPHAGLPGPSRRLAQALHRHPDRESRRPADRVHGSVAVALAGIAQGVQIVRVHDTAATRGALTLWQAATGSEEAR